MMGDKYGILGPYATEQKARTEAEDKLSHAIKFAIYPLDTKNKSAASGKLKAIVLDETKDIGQAMQRMRRKEPTHETFKEKQDNTDNDIEKINWF